jgi:sporulation protein YpjB
MLALKLKPPALLLLAIGVFAVLAAACGNGQQRSAPAAKPPAAQIAPSDEAKLEQLNQLAETMYKLTMNGSYMEARSRLLDMNALATRIQYAGVTTVEGVHALTETMTEAQRAFNAVRLQPEEARLGAAKVRLATDALTHKIDPMWLQYERVLVEDARALEEGVRTRNARAVQTAVAGLKAHYDTIRPAVIISRDPQLNEKMDSVLTFLTNQSRAVPFPVQNLEQGAIHLRETLDELFGRKDVSAFAPIADPHRPVLWTIVIGSVIAAILAYAAWQMLRDGRGEVRIRRKEQE